MHLANSASLLLPISNRTNLLAFHASGLSFTHFAALMALPTLAVIAIEWLVLRRRYVSGTRRRAADTAGSGALPALPRFPLTVLAITLLGFALSSLVDLDPIWIAAAGALAITAPALTDGRLAARELAAPLQPGFLLFALALGAIVQAAANAGLTSAARSVLPAGDSLLALLGVAAVSALLANAVNNLPATLILLPIAAASGTGSLLAMLIGVNVGPNLSPTGSLATLLWRRIVRKHDLDFKLREFLVVGALTALPAMTAATCLLWVAVRL